MADEGKILFEGEKLDKDKFNKILDQFKTESPRAIAVLSCAYLDYLLNELLKKRLIEDESLFKKVIDNLTFERRINLCYLIGAYPKRVKEDLLIINNIRNDFSHNIEMNNFRDKTIVSKCEKLHKVAKLREEFESVDFTNPQNMFTFSVIHYMYSIELFTFQICKRIEENK